MSIRENLLELRRTVEAWPEHLFDLETVTRPAPCGTLYCAAGLVGTAPYFMEMGYRIVGPVPLEQLENTHSSCLDLTLEEDFGEQAWERLFAIRRAGNFDRDLLQGIWAPVGHINDKQLALARIDKQLEVYP